MVSYYMSSDTYDPHFVTHIPEILGYNGGSLNQQTRTRLGDEERRPMDLVPAPAVRLMKRRVLSRPGVNSLMSYFYSLL